MKLKVFHKNKTGIWDFYRDGVSQSFISLFRLCPEQCRLNYYEGFSSDSYNESLHIGNCVHYVLQELYNIPNYPLAGVVLSKIREYQSIWESEQRSHFTVTQEELFEKVYTVAEVLLDLYCERYISDWKHTWLWTEKEFKIPYILPNGAQTFIRGKIDGGFEDNKKEVWLIDHKVKSIIDKEMLISILPFDTQCMMYCLAYSKLTGNFPQGIIYNIIRKPQHKKGDKSFREFKDYLEGKIREEPDHFFSRIKLRILPEEILAWEKKWLIPNLLNIEKWYQSGCKDHTMNPDALETKYGRCEMFDLITCGNSLGFYRRTKPFPELVNK